MKDSGPLVHPILFVELTFSVGNIRLACGERVENKRISIEDFGSQQFVSFHRLNMTELAFGSRFQVIIPCLPTMPQGCATTQTPS